MRAYNVRRAIATIAGIAVIGASTYLNVTRVSLPGSAWWEQPLALAVAISGIAIAAAVMVFSASLRERRYGLAIVTLGGLLAAVAFDFATTFEGTASAREDRALALVPSGNAKAAAAAMVASAAEKRAAECSVRGKKCEAAEEHLAAARMAYATAAPGKAGHYLGRYDVVPELALPLMLLLLGFAFIAYAEAAPRDGSEQTSFPADSGPLPGKEMFEPFADDDLPEIGQPSPGEVAQRRLQVASFAEAFAVKHGRSPRNIEIVRATGLPKATVSRYVNGARRRPAARRQAAG